MALQVGKDAAATRFLSALDTDPIIGAMIDCTSYYEQEQEEYARKVGFSDTAACLMSDYCMATLPQQTSYMHLWHAGLA